MSRRPDREWTLEADASPRGAGRAGRLRSGIRWQGVLLAVILAGLAAAAPLGSEARAQDDATAESGVSRLDRVNRASMRVNDWLLIHVLDELARGYNSAVPKWGQRRVLSILRNLHGPRDVFNSILQGKPRRAGIHLARFLIDSTVGVAGAFEIAEPRLGLRAPPETFGETLGVYRLGTGPFLILPFIGETSPRHLVGAVIDGLLYPPSWLSPESAGVGASRGGLALEGIGGLSQRMPPRGSASRSWTIYENLLTAGVAAPYDERKTLFAENVAFDVAE